MAKVKFDPEDFRKDPNQTSPVKPTSKGYLKYIIWGILAAVCAVLALIFVPRGCTTDVPPVVDTLVTDTISNDSVPPVVEDSISTDSVKTTQKNIEDETNDNTGTINEVNKTNETKTATQDVASVSEDITQEALSVIRGNYGNNPERRRKLKDRYQEIQNKVNEMYRNGQVK